MLRDTPPDLLRLSVARSGRSLTETCKLRFFNETAMNRGNRELVSLCEKKFVVDALKNGKVSS